MTFKIYYEAILIEGGKVILISLEAIFRFQQKFLRANLFICQVSFISTRYKKWRYIF